MREAMLKKGRAIYRSFTLDQSQELRQTFPNLTDPADPKNPHKIISNPPYHYPFSWHLEYLDNSQEFHVSRRYPYSMPVVALHGFVLNASYWEGFMHVMSGLGIRIICPFLWGLEHSEQNDVALVNFTNLSRAVVEMMQSLGFMKFVIAGQSMGGILAFEIARKYPLHVAGIMNIAGIGLRFHWGQVRLTLSTAAFCLHGISQFIRVHKERCDEVLEDYIANPRKRTYAILQPHHPKSEKFHFGENPYKPNSKLTIGRLHDTHHILCSLKFQQEFPTMFAAMRKKLNIPVFVVLGTEDYVIERSYLLEYCREKYRGSLRVSREDLLAYPINTSSSIDTKDPRILGYLKRLEEDSEVLFKIEEQNLLQVKGAGHNLHLTQAFLIGQKLQNLLSLCLAIEQLQNKSSPRPKI